MSGRLLQPTRVHEGPAPLAAVQAEPVIDARPRVFATVDYYLPGYRAGGPIRAVANLIDRLGDDYAFHVFTRCHDLGGAPYDVPRHMWLPHGTARVCYGDAGLHGLQQLARQIAGVAPDLLYLNSFFSRFSMAVLALRAAGRLPRVPMIIAPRGELAASALRHRHSAKRAWIALARRAGLYDDAVWQASSELEAHDIAVFLETYGEPAARVIVARELRSRQRHAATHPAKRSGRLRAVFIARICRIKNLAAAIRSIARVEGDVLLDIYGPLEDTAYWAECQDLMRAARPGVSFTYRGEIAPDRVPDVLASYDVLLLPTLGENFGHVIVEALGAGTPAVISDRTPWRNLEAHSAGRDVPLQDEDALRHALQHFTAMADGEFRTWREGARSYVERASPTDQIVQENRRLFADALAPAGRHVSQDRTAQDR